MFHKIIEASVNNKLMVLLLTAAMVFAGIQSFRKLPVDAVPDITNNQVQVITQSPDLAAQEIEQFITFPVEQALATIPGKVELRSFSRMGLSLVTIVFGDDIDIYWARQQVTERLREAEAMIPAGMGKPELTPVTTGLGEIYQYILRPSKGYEKVYSLADLRTIQDWIIRRQLLGVKGLADVSSFGGHLKQYEIAMKPEAMQSLDISLDEVITAVERNNRNAGGSYIERQGGNVYIRAEALFSNAEDLGYVHLATRPDGTPVRLLEVADIREGSAIRFGAMTSDTLGETVGGVVLMLKGANSSEVIREVKTRIAEIRKSLPPGIELRPYLDRTRLVNNALGTVSKNLIEGALIVILVLVLLLGNLRAGLVVASVIPLSMLFAIIMMQLTGVSGNLMSLGAIDFGLIVDAAVIIVEAVVHSLAKGGVYTRSDMNLVVTRNAGKMMRFAAFGQLIILMVYLPILSLEGVEGKMFRPMAETVAYAILGALLLSLTWVPVAASMFLSRREPRESFSDRMMARVSKAYGNALQKVLKKGKMVLAAALALLVASFFLFNQLGAEFIPTLEEGDFAVETRVPLGSSLNTTIEASQKAAGILLRNFPEVEMVTGKIGTSEIPTDPMPVEACDMIISLRDKSEWTSAETREELADTMQKVLQQIPGVTFGFQQPIQMRFNELMTGARQDVVIKIYGEDLDSLGQLAQRIGQITGTIPGAQDVYVEQVVGLPQLIVRPDRAALLRYSLDADDVLQAIQVAYAGRELGWIFEGEKRFRITVRLSEAHRNDPETLDKLSIRAPNGQLVPLQAVAEVRWEEGPVQIQREEARRRAIVGFNVRERDVASVVTELKQILSKKVKLPTGYNLEYGGQFRNLEQAVERLSIAVPVALIIILILLYFTFNSVKNSLLVFSAVPFAAIGGVLALWLRDMPFSISAGVGFIALSGVAVLNGIVLIGAFVEREREGHELDAAIRLGASSRIRPVLMTALVASLGFLPMAIANSSGAEVQRPLATVVMGGLVTATLLTLFLLPVLYRMAAGRKGKATAIPVALGLLIAMPAAQAQTPAPLSLDSLLARARKNHPRIAQADYEAQATKALQGAAWDLGPTTLNTMAGQYNSQNQDLYFQVLQSLPNPARLQAQAKVAHWNTQVAESRREMTTREVLLQVRILWEQLLWLREEERILRSQDSLLNQLSQRAERMLQSGSVSPLHPLQVQAEQAAIASKRAALQSLSAVSAQMLGFLTASAGPCAPPESLRSAKLALPKPSGFVNPSIRALEFQKQVALWNLKTERRRLLPDLELGYFNQSLTGFQNLNGNDVYFDRSYRFTGFQAGISMPLVFHGTRSRIHSAQWQLKASESALGAAQMEEQQKLLELQASIQAADTQLEWFQNRSLPLSRETRRVAMLEYQSGEIGISEVLRILSQNLEVERNYQQLLRDYNFQILHLQNRMLP
jgi:cobalt-zinc-cadmium resistance protein CzcA